MQAPNLRGRGLGLGTRKAEGARTPGERAREAPGCLSVSDGEGTKCRRSFLFRLLWNTGGLEPRAAAGHAPYRTAGSLSSVAGESSTSPSPQRNRTSNLNKSPPRPPVSGRKLGTEETGKEKPNKEREPLQKGPVQQIKTPVDNTDYTRRAL